MHFLNKNFKKCIDYQCFVIILRELFLTIVNKMNSKFLTIFALFTEKEVKKFQLYLQSPLFKVRSRASCLQLFKNLVEAKGKDGFQEIERTKLIEKTFGKDKGGENLLNVHLTHLYQSLENYMMHTFEHAVESPLWEEKLWATFRYVEYLGQKELHTLFEKKLGALQKAITATKLSEKRYYIEWQVAQLIGNYRLQNTDKRKENNLGVLIAAHQKHQILSTLKIACQQYNMQKIAAGVFQNVQFLEQETLKDPLIDLYHQAYMSLKEDKTAEEIEAWISQIKEQATHIDTDEIKNLTLYAQNICIRKIKQNKPYFYQVYIKIVQFLAGADLLAQAITERYFINITQSAVRSNNFEWGNQFIENYAFCLPKEIQNQTKGLCKGILAFNQGDFTKTLEALLPVQLTKDPFLEINRRSLIIQSYYELDSHTYLEEQINTYIRFLTTRSKLKETDKKAYKQFHQHLKKLYKLRADLSLWNPSQQQEKLSALQKEIQTRNAVKKSWLLVKVAALRNN